MIDLEISRLLPKRPSPSGIEMILTSGPGGLKKYQSARFEQKITVFFCESKPFLHIQIPTKC